MPFDLEKGNGTWKTVRTSDNYGEILQKMGVPPELVEMMMTAEGQIEIKTSGNTFTWKRTIFGKTMENTFTLGVECEETDMTGTKRKVTFDWEGDVIVSVYPNHDGKGLVVRTSRRWTDDKTVRFEYKVGDLEGWMDTQKM